MRKEKSLFADTSFLIDLLRSEENATEIAKSSSEVATSSLCIFELGRKVDFSLEQVTDRAIVDFRAEDAEKAYRIYRNLEARGEKVNGLDYLLAAQAINLGSVMLTADEDFKKIEDLETRYYRSL